MSPKDKARASHLLRTYGITPEMYDELLVRQGGGCGVCSKTPEEEGQSLAVDHDHKTQEIRGILCRYCNHRVVGRHRDSSLLRRVADYLDRHTGWFVPEKTKSRRRRATGSERTRRGKRKS